MPGMFKVKTDNTSKVYISGYLTVLCVKEFHRKMQDLLNKGSYTTFDLAGVEKIDVSALQIFLSYKRSIQKESKFSVINASKDVKKTIKLTGFAKALKYIG